MLKEPYKCDSLLVGEWYIYTFNYEKEKKKSQIIKIEYLTFYMELEREIIKFGSNSHNHKLTLMLLRPYQHFGHFGFLHHGFL